MYLTFKKNNKWTKKPVNRFLQDGASAVREWTLGSTVGKSGKNV